MNEDDVLVAVFDVTAEIVAVVALDTGADLVKVYVVVDGFYFRQFFLMMHCYTSWC